MNCMGIHTALNTIPTSAGPVPICTALIVVRSGFFRFSRSTAQVSGGWYPQHVTSLFKHLRMYLFTYLWCILCYLLVVILIFSRPLPSHCSAECSQHWEFPLLCILQCHCPHHHIVHGYNVNMRFPCHCHRLYWLPSSMSFSVIRKYHHLVARSSFRSWL